MVIARSNRYFASGKYRQVSHIGSNCETESNAKSPRQIPQTPKRGEKVPIHAPSTGGEYKCANAFERLSSERSNCEAIYAGDRLTLASKAPQWFDRSHLDGDRCT
jgi:hypothetical protein